MSRWRTALLALCVLLLLASSACTRQEPVLSTEVDVLCSPSVEWCQGMKQEFEARYRITANVTRLSSGDALARVISRKDNPEFDIWWGGPSDGYVAAKQAGVLQPYNSPSYRFLTDQGRYKDRNNYWAGVYSGTIAFATSKIWLAQNPQFRPPESWDDLLRPEFAGKLVMAHPATSGTAYTVLATVLQMRGQDEGWSYLKRLGGQISEYTRSGAAPAAIVGRGGAAAAILFSHDIVSEIEEEGAAIAISFPQEGTGYEVGGMAILKGAQHLDAAKLWFDWALTPDAEGLGAKYNAFQAPTAQGVRPARPELMQVKLAEYNSDWAGQRKQEFIERFNREIAPPTDLH